MQKSNKIVEAARELLSSFGYHVGNLWHIDDIHFICEQNSYPRVSDQEAKEVFAIVDAQFDGEEGICWPQLEKALFAYYERHSIPFNSDKHAEPA